MTGEGIDAYSELDLRSDGDVTDNWSLSLVGQNLLDESHVEFGTPQARGALERSRIRQGGLAQLGRNVPRHAITSSILEAGATHLCRRDAVRRERWAAPPASEYQVKAAYLFNFGQFVEWPAQSYPSPNAPFVIGVVGRDPFGKTLDDVVRGESLGGRPFVVRRFKDADDIDGLPHPVHRTQRDRSAWTRLSKPRAAATCSRSPTSKARSGAAP